MATPGTMVCHALFVSRLGVPYHDLRFPPNAAVRDAASRRLAFRDAAGSGQRFPAVFDSPGNFGHAIRTGRNLVLDFDRSLNVPAIVPDQAQYFGDRSVALAEWRVRPVMHFP